MVRSAGAGVRAVLAAVAVSLAATGCAGLGRAGMVFEAGGFRELDPGEPGAVSPDEAAKTLIRQVLPRGDEWGPQFAAAAHDELDAMRTDRVDDDCETVPVGMPQDTRAVIGRRFALPPLPGGSLYGMSAGATISVHGSESAARAEVAFAADSAERCGVLYVDSETRIEGVERITLPGAAEYDEVSAEHGIRTDGTYSPREMYSYVSAVARTGEFVVTVFADAPRDAGAQVGDELRARVSDMLELLLSRLLCSRI
ncbi:hypothetical protein [Yinghuangia soli]|uniref:Lipoprotein n=1 Tax=Yinghuangia soli TaxID=2908204 RepID=A0AA41Q188_9ACTN|nr:hypothetical protein [Yinghuangia soli]MCF2528207.1 hypothetical protein [Yinghuangia soli]